MVAVGLILLLVVAVFALYGVAIGGTVDALGQPREVWAHAGFRRRSWMWQALGVFCLPAAVGYSGAYFFRVRPRLIAATLELDSHRSAAPTTTLSTSDPAEDAVLTIRMPWSVSVATACAPLVGALIGLGLVGGLTDVDRVPPPLLGYAVAAVVLTPLSRRFGARLTAEAVIVRGLRKRHIPWSDIEMVQEYSTLGTQSVRLWTHGGRRYRLRAPCAIWGLGREQFDRDIAAIQRTFRARTT